MSATIKGKYDRRAAAIRTNPNRKGTHYHYREAGEEEEERAPKDPYRLLIIAVVQTAVDDLHLSPESSLGYEARKWLAHDDAALWLDMLDIDLKRLRERVNGDAWAIVEKSKRSC